MAVVRELLAWQVTDLLEETARRLAAANIRSVADVRSARSLLVGFTPEVAATEGRAGAVPARAGLQAPSRAAHDGQRASACCRPLFAEYVRTPGVVAGEASAPLDGGGAADRPAAAGLASRRLVGPSIAWNEWSAIIWPA